MPPPPPADPQERELELLVRARYPLVWLVSWEERRMAQLLERLADKRGKRLWFWSVTEGLVEARERHEAGAREPVQALEFIARSEEPALFVLRDFHPFLKAPEVVRRLRDLVLELRASYKTVVLLSPVLELPVELEKDVTVLDYDLPGPEELRRLLAEAAAASRAGSRFRVELDPLDEERLVQAAQGMTLAEAESAFARAIVVDDALSVSDVGIVLQEKKQIIRKSRLLEYVESGEEMSAVGGLGLLKDWLRKRGRAFWEEARQFGLPPPRGILLLGVQGCGKSLVCKSVASAWKLPLLRLDMGAIFGGVVGQSEENTRRAIRTAEAIAPCVLWLDEIEKGLAGTQSSSFSDAGTTARVFSTLLTWLQEKTKPVFVAATANDVQQLPPELLRRGRLDEIFFIDLPGRDERREILAIHLAKMGRDPARFDLEALAGATPGFSGAELEQVIVGGLHDAFDRGSELRQEDLEGAARATIPLSRTMSESIEATRRWAAARARPSSAAADEERPAAGPAPRRLRA